MKSLLRFIDFKVRMIVILDSFNSWQLPFVNPVYELPWAMSFVGDFLDFLVKE